MSKTDLISCLLRQHHSKLSQAQKLFLEVKFLISIYHEVSEIFHSRYKEYQTLTKCNQENEMLSVRFIPEMIKDILLTEEYTLAGIANHTNIPEEVLSDIMVGANVDPTFETSRKIFELLAVLALCFFAVLIAQI